MSFMLYLVLLYESSCTGVENKVWRLLAGKINITFWIETINEDKKRVGSSKIVLYFRGATRTVVVMLKCLVSQLSYVAQSQ